jgi:hypothetical protein
MIKLKTILASLVAMFCFTAKSMTLAEVQNAFNTGDYDLYSYFRSDIQLEKTENLKKRLKTTFPKEYERLQACLRRFEEFTVLESQRLGVTRQDLEATDAHGLRSTLILTLNLGSALIVALRDFIIDRQKNPNRVELYKKFCSLTCSGGSSPQGIYYVYLFEDKDGKRAYTSPIIGLQTLIEHEVYQELISAYNYGIRYPAGTLYIKHLLDPKVVEFIDSVLRELLIKIIPEGFFALDPLLKS